MVERIVWGARDRADEVDVVRDAPSRLIEHRQLVLVDGKSNLTMGYEMKASMIEDYYEKEN